MKYETAYECSIQGDGFLATINNPVICQNCGANRGNHFFKGNDKLYQPNYSHRLSMFESGNGLNEKEYYQITCSCGFTTGQFYVKKKSRKAIDKTYRRWFLHLTEMKIRGLLIN